MAQFLSPLIYGHFCYSRCEVKLLLIGWRSHSRADCLAVRFLRNKTEKGLKGSSVGHNTQGLPAASWSHLQLNRFILLHLQLLLLGGFPSTAHLCRLFSDCKVEGLSCLTAKLCLYHLTPLSPGTEHCLRWQQGRRKINYHKAVDPVHSNQFIPAPKT